MGYSTYSDCVGRYRILEDWPGKTTGVNSSLIYFGDVQLNSMLAPKYTVPFSDTPPTVRDLSIDFAYLKSLQYGNDTEKWKEVNEQLQERIERILDGDEKIYTDSGTIIDPVTASGVNIWSSTEGYESTHSMLGAESPYEGISSEHLQDLRTDRGYPV